MLDQKQIERIKNFKSKDYPVISFYLGINPAKDSQEKIRLKVKDVIKNNKVVLSQDVKRAIMGFMKEEIPEEFDGIAIFSCLPLKFFEAIYLPSRVRDEVHIGHEAYLKPLEKAFNNFQRTVVILVDRKKSHFYSVYLGEIEEEKEVSDPVHGRHDQGGWSQSRFQKHIKEQIDRHLQKVADRLFNYFKAHKFDQLVICASKDILLQFEKKLHPYLRKRLIKKIPKDFLDDIRKDPKNLLGYLNIEY